MFLERSWQIPLPGPSGLSSRRIGCRANHRRHPVLLRYTENTHRFYFLPVSFQSKTAQAIWQRENILPHCLFAIFLPDNASPENLLSE